MPYQWTTADRREFEVLPLDRSHTIPAHWYSDSAILELEKANIFRGSWMYVGHVGQISKPGDYFVAELLQQPLLTVRQSNGSIRCFANVCRHRGGPLATEAGSGRTLRCHYHAWTYSLDGQLIGAPKFEGAKDFEKQNCRLPEFRIESYEGFLFVNLDGKAQPLQEHLSGIQKTIAPLSLGEMNFHKRVVYTVKANWKVYVDNFMEGYHILPIHPGLAKMLDVTGYKTQIEGNKVLQHGPLSGTDNPYQSDGTAYYYQIFPNLMFNILPGRVQINSILPLDAQNCLTVFDFYYDNRSPDTLAERIQADLEMSDLVQQEDIAICEQVQKGLTSGSYTQGRLCPSEELGIWGFHNQIRAAYRVMAEQHSQ